MCHILKSAELKNGVYFLSELQEQFSSIYLDVRNKEERVYSDKITAKLPYVTKDHRYYNEWKVRQESTKRIKSFLTAKNKPLKILDLGCGNGWFSNQLTHVPDAKVFAVDVNDLELAQAARVFQKPELKFIYADIFSIEADGLQKFDIITVNSCIQYFKNLKETITHLKGKLKAGGELHIIDSPFYKREEIKAAQQRTHQYFENLGFPEMTGYYYHHSLEYESNYKILYQPKKSLINKVFRKKNSPFMWLKFKKE